MTKTLTRITRYGTKKYKREGGSPTGAADTKTVGDGVGTQSPMIHGAAWVSRQSVPLTEIVLEQHASDPPVPGIVPHPTPPHWPQFSAQLFRKENVVTVRGGLVRIQQSPWTELFSGCMYVYCKHSRKFP